MVLPDPLPVLRGPRLVLRQAEHRDRDALYGLHTDVGAMRYWSGPPWTDPAKADEMLARDRVRREAGEAVRLLIVDHADPADAPIGYVSLHRIDAQSRRAELGYLVRADLHGRGYATEAVHVALDWAFAALDLHRIEADTDPRNASSIHLLERLGFTREGLLRERWIVSGEVSDTALYGLLAREWRMLPR